MQCRPGNDKLMQGMNMYYLHSLSQLFFEHGVALCLQAYAELQTYVTTETGQNAPLQEKELVRRLLGFMQAQAGAEPAAAPYTLEKALTEEIPVVDSKRMIPLTW